MEMTAASRLHMAPKHLRSSSRSDARCSWQKKLCAQCPDSCPHPSVPTPSSHTYHLVIGHQGQDRLELIPFAHFFANFGVCISL